MKKIFAVAIVLAIGGAVAWQQTHRDEAAPIYRFVEIEEGDVISTVSATGALDAVKTVDVGTQVSGQIANIYVDFNDVVRRGQLIARIDPTLQEQAVREAEVSVERAQADLTHAEQVFERDRQLFERQVLTQSEFETSQYNLAISKTGLASAEAGLLRAQRNLDYTYIYAPVDGVVVELAVDEGQTVAASQSAPLLFQIAEDLSKMEILANVDESDIGLIQVGQPTRFTVQAYPSDRFEGTVRQVRLQSTMAENVVSYTVVIDVPNPDRRLLPGMTATVDFIIDAAHDVTRISNAALRFRPSDEMLAAFQSQREPGADTMRAAYRGSIGAHDLSEARERMGAQGPADARERMGARGVAEARNVTTLWTLDEAGSITPVPVRTGLSDGQHTVVEPLAGGMLAPGTQVIAGMTQAGGQSSATNPFQNNGSSGPRFGPPGGF